MIDIALKHIVKEVNNYLHSFESLNIEPNDNLVVLGNIAKLESGGSNDSSNPMDDKVILTLVNIEEDKILKNGATYTVRDSTIHKHNPPVILNLCLLFSANTTSYDKGLTYLSKIITFFQGKYVFTPQNSPGLDSRIDKLILDIHSLNLEYLNHLWGVLGGKYYPSMLYKMRLLELQEAPQEKSAVVSATGGNENSL